MVWEENDVSQSDLYIPRFKGKAGEDYQLCHFEVEAALRGKQYWSQLHEYSWPDMVKDHAFSILVAALGDMSLRNCQKDAPEAIKIWKTLDSCYVCKRAGSRIAALKSI